MLLARAQKRKCHELLEFWRPSGCRFWQNFGNLGIWWSFDGLWLPLISLMALGSRDTVGIIESSTLHCRGKNGLSKKIGQTNQKMIYFVIFVPNMYVSGKISALRPGTQTVMIFGTATKILKLPKTTRFQDLRVFAFFVGFCGVLRVFSLVVWCAASIILPLSHKIMQSKS